MSTDKQENNLKKKKKRELLKKSIAENPIYRALSNSLADEGISADIENFVDRYIAVLGMDNLKNDVAFDENEINKFIIGAIDYISKEKNGLVLNQDGTKDYKSSFEQKMDIIYEGIPDYAKETVLNNEQNWQLFFLEDISNEENNFFEKLISGETNSSDVYKNLNYQYNNGKDGFLERTENNRLETFIESKDELNLIMMCAQYDNTSDPAQKEEYLKKIGQLPQVQKIINARTGKIDTEKVLDIGRSWRKNYIEGKRKLDLINYNKLRESGKNFSELSNEDKNAVLRSAVRIFENPKASMETKKIAQAVLLDISPELLEISRNEDGSIVSSINDSSLVSLYNGINPEKKVENANEIRDIYADQETSLTMKKLEEIGRAETLMTYDQWKQISIARDREISDINKKIDDISEFTGFDTSNYIDTFNEIRDSDDNKPKGLKAFLGKAVQSITTPFNKLMARLKTPKLPEAIDNEFQTAYGGSNSNQVKSESKDNNPFAVSQEIIDNVNRVSKETMKKANNTKKVTAETRTAANEDKEDVLSFD